MGMTLRSRAPGNPSEGANFTSEYTAARIYIHALEEIQSFFEDLDLVPPGVVPVRLWTGDTPAPTTRPPPPPSWPASPANPEPQHDDAAAMAVAGEDGRAAGRASLTIAEAVWVLIFPLTRIVFVRFFAEEHEQPG
jgi:hypothetical protein